MAKWDPKKKFLNRQNIIAKFSRSKADGYEIPETEAPVAEVPVIEEVKDTAPEPAVPESVSEVPVTEEVKDTAPEPTVPEPVTEIPVPVTEIPVNEALQADPPANPAAENETHVTDAKMVNSVTDDTIVLDTGSVNEALDNAAAEQAYLKARADARPDQEIPQYNSSPGPETADGFSSAKEAAKKALKADKLKAVFSDRPVSRKFFTIALAAVVVLNAAFTAGLLALFNDKDSKTHGSSDGRPGAEQFDDDFGSGLTPPGDNGNDFSAPDSRQSSPWDDQWGDDRDYDQEDDQLNDIWGNGQDNDQWDSLPDNGQSQDNGQWGTLPDSGQSQDNDGSQLQQNSSKASIGIVISDNNGVYISDISGENAKSAGFEKGDKIVAFDGENISNSNDLISALQKHSSGDKVKVKVERDGKNKTISTVLE